jgi:hypothetical protein
LPFFRIRGILRIVDNASRWRTEMADFDFAVFTRETEIIWLGHILWEHYL